MTQKRINGSSIPSQSVMIPHDICGLVYRTTKMREISGGMMEPLLLTEIGERDNQVTAMMKTTFTSQELTWEQSTLPPGTT